MITRLAVAFLVGAAIGGGIGIFLEWIPLGIVAYAVLTGLASATLIEGDARGH